MEQERGESSGAKPLDEIWAKLVPSDSRYSDIEIRSDEIVICSEISSTSTDKHSWCKIVRNSDLCSATIENKRPNTILVDGTEVCNEDTIAIKDGSEIIPGPDGGFVNYRFNIISSPETCQRQLKICVDIDHAKCSICLNIWHDVVTVAPCLHNFCNGCFSEWLRRSQEKRSSVLCPQCRAVVQFAGKNHFLRTIAEDMIRADSSLRRSDDDVALLDKYSAIRSNLVIGSGKKRRKTVATPTTALDDRSDSPELQCPQCVSEVGGFQCNQTTVHLQCQACGGMMPSRTVDVIPQYCSGCDRSFCGAYWQALGVTGSGSYPVCSRDTLKPISEHTISRVPLTAHEKNLHEQRITENCIRQMGRTLQDVLSEWMLKFDSKLIDRTRLMLNNAEMITARTPVCSDCYQKLVSFLLYWFRISCPRHVSAFNSNQIGILLVAKLTLFYVSFVCIACCKKKKKHIPADALAREDCWYGYACRTQHRSEEHARKRNHVCRPTRGTGF